MKYYSCCSFFLILSLLSIAFLIDAHSDKNHDPLLVVVIMVKNEEAVICDTLMPYVQAGINSFFVFDTGSTDKTIEVAQSFFEEHRVTEAYIVQEPFINFAVSRNRALELTQAQFPHAAFMLMPDAEWYMVNVEGLLDFCEQALECDEQYPTYLVRILNDYNDFYTSRLIRCNYGVRFIGAVHEGVIQETRQRVPEDIFFEWLPSDAGIKSSEARFIRDRIILEEELKKNPYHTRTLFYLARVCASLDLEAAYDYYKRRIALVGWDEEDFIAHLCLGQVIERLSSYNKNYSWQEALIYYLHAHQMRPWRAEPLVALADHYIREDQIALAFLFAQRAVEIPYPTNDLLFVQKYEYEYYRYELLARSAWYMGEFEIGEWAAEIAAAYDPNNEVAQKNRAWYTRAREQNAHALL